MSRTPSAELTVAGLQPASRLGQWSWALFDWANQPFFTLITTFIFAPYFTTFVVGDPVRGQELWGYAQAAAGALIAICSPVLGAMADAGGPRKPWIALFQAVCVTGCALLWFALPGAGPGALAWSLAAIVLAILGAEFAIVVNNAMLPSLTTEARLGRLSGYAWALGYVGGLISLFFVLFAFSLPETPLFGLDKATHEPARITGPLTAVWIVIFVIPLFLFTPDLPPAGIGRREAARRGLRQLSGTLRKARHYRNMLIFLGGRMLYFDGLSAIFAFGGIYAAGAFDWTTENLGIFGIVLTVFAALGAALGGVMDDRLGSKRTIMVSLVGLLAATLGVISIGVEPAGEGMRRETVLFVLTAEVVIPEGGMFTTLGEQVFLGFGILIGIFGGPVQAASRTMVSRLSPPAMVGEFYGLYALSGKATAFIAPFAVAAFTGLFDSQRIGLVPILAFLAVGFLVMLWVREERAEAVA